MTQLEAMLPAALARLGLGPDDVTPSLVASVGPTSQITWASPSAYELFGTHTLDELGHILLRADDGARAFAQWLNRLGNGPEVGQVTVETPESGRLSASCVALPLDDEDHVLIRVHAAPSVSLRSTHKPDISTPRAAKDDAQPIRVLWQTDRDGIVTQAMGTDDCPPDLRIFAVGVSATSRLQAHAPEFADRLRYALQHREPIGLTRVPWPRSEMDGSALLEIGCTARPGLSGLRGFLLIHAVSVANASLKASIPEVVEQPDFKVSEIVETAQAAAAPLVEDTLDSPAVANMPGREDPALASLSASGPQDPTGNVVHFPVMRLTAVPASFTAELRPMSASNTPVEIDAPRWSEQPSQARTGPPKELTADEQDAFAHIARVLGTRPSGRLDSHLEAPTPDGRMPPANTSVDDLFTAFPHGLLLRRGDRVDTNPALLQRLGDETTEAFETRFRGRNLTAPGQLTHVDGTAVLTETHDLQWRGASAQLVLALPSPPREDAEIVPNVPVRALDAVTDGFLLLDAAGAVLTASPRAGQLFGAAPKDLVGCAVADLLPNHGVSDWDHAEASRRQNLCARTRTGETVPLAIEIAPFGTGALCILLVDRRATEPSVDRNRAHKDAERGSALSSELLAKIGHEIRTPLNALLGFAEIVRDERLGPLGNRRYLEYLRDIHAAGTHVMNLVNDLLDLSRIGAGRLDLRLQAVDTNATVQACVGTLQAQAQRQRVVVRLSLAPHLSFALADEHSFRQIVLNLLSNAIKYNEPGGQVIVSTASADRDSVAIRIRDTGIGMTDDEVAAAMEPFNQLSAINRTGSGLGLPLTKALVEANCASMAIKSSRGEGTLVEVLFPVVEMEALSRPAQ